MNFNSNSAILFIVAGIFSAKGYSENTPELLGAGILLIGIGFLVLEISELEVSEK